MSKPCPGCGVEVGNLHYAGCELEPDPVAWDGVWPGDVDPSARGRPCSGKCCEAFSLGAPPHWLRRILPERDPDAALILDMLIPLGSFNRNPLHRVRGDFVGEVVRNPDTCGHSWFYTCKHFSRTTRRCLIYDRRPYMCREFPNWGACPFEGCGYSKKERMVLIHFKDGESVVYAGHSPRLCCDDVERLAKALGVSQAQKLGKPLGKALVEELVRLGDGHAGS